MGKGPLRAEASSSILSFSAGGLPPNGRGRFDLILIAHPDNHHDFRPAGTNARKTGGPA